MVNVTKTNYDTAMLVGARPNFVKVAPLLSKFEENNQKVLFIHTGGEPAFFSGQGEWLNF